MNRKEFIRNTALLGVGVMATPHSLWSAPAPKGIGVQLYSFRDAMAKDAEGTLRHIASLGFTKIESARSGKGHYYGLSPEGMSATCRGLGMELVSGHVALDDNFDATVEEAVASGQEYLICSSLPYKGQDQDTYKKVAEAFNKAGETCKHAGVKFGYHNHGYEFESEGDVVLYDLLLNHTDPDLVHMELDLGWVVMAGKDPLAYFNDYPGRFPLWHLKDMDLEEGKSTEFGKGALDIKAMMAHQEASGVRHIFVEQEEYGTNPTESMKHNMAFLEKL